MTFSSVNASLYCLRYLKHEGAGGKHLAEGTSEADMYSEVLAVETERWLLSRGVRCMGFGCLELTFFKCL